MLNHFFVLYPYLYINRTSRQFDINWNKEEHLIPTKSFFFNLEYSRGICIHRSPLQYIEHDHVQEVSRKILF